MKSIKGFKTRACSLSVACAMCLGCGAHPVHADAWDSLKSALGGWDASIYTGGTSVTARADGSTVSQDVGALAFGNDLLPDIAMPPYIGLRMMSWSSSGYGLGGNLSRTRVAPIELPGGTIGPDIYELTLRGAYRISSETAVTPYAAVEIGLSVGETGESGLELLGPVAAVSTGLEYDLSPDTAIFGEVRLGRTWLTDGVVSGGGALDTIAINTGFTIKF